MQSNNSEVDLNTTLEDTHKMYALQLEELQSQKEIIESEARQKEKRQISQISNFREILSKRQNEFQQKEASFVDL